MAASALAGSSAACEHLSRVVRGRAWTGGEKTAAPTAVHYGFGAVRGATYGVVAALELVLHVLYGVTVEAVRALLH